MEPQETILLLWVFFAGTHLVGSSRPVRGFLVRTLGLRGFKGLYSVVALATFVPLCYVYFTNRHAGALLYAPRPWFRHVTEALMLVALFVFVQAQATPSPMSTRAEMSGRYGAGARGIQRVTRHPASLAFGIFGAAHCLVNPLAGDWVFFGGFVVYALVGAMHQDRRVLATGAEPARRFLEETSFLPFAAILAGRQRLALRELRPVAAAVALAIFVLLRLLHGRLFGGFGA